MNFSLGQGDLCFTCKEHVSAGDCQDELTLFKAAITRREEQFEVTTDYDRLKFFEASSYDYTKAFWPVGVVGAGVLIGTIVVVVIM